jgi:hypothetical protein
MTVLPIAQMPVMKAIQYVKKKICEKKKLACDGTKHCLNGQDENVKM